MNGMRLGRCWSVLCTCIVFGLIPIGVAYAVTWHITHDPAEPEDRIGAVAALAASGDSILIDPGTYYEHIPLEGKALTFVGVGGANVTILDGGRPLPGRQGSIIYTLTGAPADLALEGLTLRNGTGTPYGPSDLIAGGAVHWWKASQAASLTVVDCIFEDNITGGPDNGWVVGGGAIFAHDLNGVSIERCSFSGNTTTEAGGDLYLDAGSAVVTQCDFVLDEDAGSDGASIYGQAGTLTIRECTFQAEAVGSWRYGVTSCSRRVRILDNRFIDRGSPLATAMDLGCCYCTGTPPQDVLISRNLFWNASGPDSAGSAYVWAYQPGGAFVIRENTFVRCGIDVQNTDLASPITFENNIIARGTARFFIPLGGELSCNDFWLTAMTDVIGTLTQSTSP
jgi:hypothetical protein